jgi:hypothetical protein
MPLRIAIQAVPRQQLSVQFDGQRYVIELKETRGVVCATFTINEVLVASNIRFLADGPLIPYDYMEGIGGNFIMTVEGDALPDYTQFDVTQFLYYLSAAEVADARA